MQDYKDIFLKAMQENICDAIQNYYKKVKKSNIIDLDACRTVYKGLMMKGIIVTYETIYQVFETMYQTFNYDGEEFK